MILMYELTVGYKCKASGTYQHEVYRRPYFNLGACLNKITALSEKYDIEFSNIVSFEVEPIESVKIRKVTVDELSEMLCESGDSDATI